MRRKIRRGAPGILSKPVWGVLVSCALGRAAIGDPVAPSPGGAGERTERFDRDPGWEGRNNRPGDRKVSAVKVKQDFGYSPTSYAGGKAGEMGGFIFAAAETAYYGQVIEPRTFNDALSASGTLALRDGGTHLLLGFFNAETVNEWRTPNTIAIRINGRGDRFFAYVEYATSRWRAGGDNPQPFPVVKDPNTGRSSIVGFPSGGKAHAWSIVYDPQGNNGGGAVTATLDGRTAICNLDAGHKADGAVFNRFGILNVSKSADGGTEAYVDDLTVNGQAEAFDQDPRWDGRNNRRSYETLDVRPWFDFGYSATHFAGGKAQGEMGGLTFRGDCRYPERMASYGDRIGPLALDKPFRASGKVAMRRGVSDSTTFFGFFHSQDSMRSNPSQSDAIPESLVGVGIEGPSSEGFFFYPVRRAKGGNSAAARDRDCPRILPDGVTHDWTLAYDPKGADGRGRITASLDGRSGFVDLAEGDKTRGTRFDRFGIVTAWIDGNGQRVYFDDLTYTCRQD